MNKIKKTSKSLSEPQIKTDCYDLPDKISVINLIKKINGSDNGVEFRELGEIASIKRGRRVTKEELSPEKEYPVYSGGVTPMGYFEKCNQSANTITVVKYGTAGFVNYITEAFWANDVCYCVKPNEVLNNKFLFYVLKDKQDYIQSQATDAIPAHLPTDKIEKIKIPLPPLPVQQEIVNILDKFTALEAELEAELEARKQQYEYYRNALLNFNEKSPIYIYREREGVIWKTLGEVCKNIMSGKNTNRKEDGLYPVYGSTGIIAYTDANVYENEQLLVARVGANAGFVHIGNGKYDVSDNTLIIQNKEDDIKLKFLYYLLVNMNLNQYAKGGGQPLITAGQLKSIKIPIPPIEEQNRIVVILDKFDALVNDISVGLPAEIAARRQQYEYYRNKLLAFV
ncbi:MAG: restriction endonuclease subunit S [Candidatus Symbiothrix sp.]|jgi:type I restriction enzyme S subunit|nr:restriction endonuclease subunit S [Candidatus Symbiothrix sp.]